MFDKNKIKYGGGGGINISWSLYLFVVFGTGLKLTHKAAWPTGDKLQPAVWMTERAHWWIRQLSSVGWCLMAGAGLF
jgi:hypothetical protein